MELNFTLKLYVLGLIELCTSNRKCYDLVHMLMALPLLTKEKISEGFNVTVVFYRNNIETQLDENDKLKLNKLFDYYKKTWLQGILI